MRIVLTGATGFLGWHTRLRLNALTDHDVIPVGRAEWPHLEELVAQADSIIHIAGVNRADTDGAVAAGNIDLAHDLATAIRARTDPLRVVYANSIQAGNGTPYGEGKAIAAQALRDAVAATDGRFVDVLLPNLFGEHGRPGYNSFVATFAHATVTGLVPTIRDNSVGLLSAQTAASALITGLRCESASLRPEPDHYSVREVWDLFQEFHACYMPMGEFPDLSTRFRVDLFNTYRAALFPTNSPIKLVRNTDSRGTFIETVRSRAGESQSSLSTTLPRVTRGEHYHLAKIERFAVMSGQATIGLRRMFTNQAMTFTVDGDTPVAVDMPVGWAHNLTNTGPDLLITQFWSHELYRPEAPDTFPANVVLQEHSP